MLVGLNGYPGVGKDTVAAILAQRGWGRVAFADPLRDMLYRMNLMSLQSLVDAHGWDYVKRHHPCVREWLQNLGEAVRQVIGQDTFIDLCIARIFEIEEQGIESVIVTDVRMQNEVDAINGLGGFVVRLHRDTVVPFNDHISEQIPQGMSAIIDATHMNPDRTADAVIAYAVQYYT